MLCVRWLIPLTLIHSDTLLCLDGPAVNRGDGGGGGKLGVWVIFILISALLYAYGFYFIYIMMMDMEGHNVINVHLKRAPIHFAIIVKQSIFKFQVVRGQIGRVLSKLSFTRSVRYGTDAPRCSAQTSQRRNVVLPLRRQRR